MSRGIVAAGHPVTAEAGARVLREGGNAVDAVVGAMLASWVAEPLLNGPGAGGYLLVARPGRDPCLLDFFVEAPGRGLPDARRRPLLPVDVFFGDVMQRFYGGVSAAGTYGTPAGYADAVRRWGTMPLRELCAPAARLAREGVPINAPQGYVFEILARLLTSSPEGKREFAPQGRILAEGDVFRSEDLARAIEILGDEGPVTFYRGEIAERVSRWVQGREGHLTRQDLAAYEPVVRTPLRTRYRGRDVLTNPPPNAGGVLLALAMSELDRTPGPPQLTDVVGVMERAQGLRTDEFTNGLADEGFVEGFLAKHLGNTTHVSVVDADGMAASGTCTNGEGCGVIVPGTGIHLNNIMGEEDLSPTGFHVAPPGTRMPSMMAPTVVLRDGEVELCVGSAGSNRIRSAILQTVVAVVDHGMSADEAIRAPRVHFEGGTVYAEPGVPLGELQAENRTIVTFPAPNLFFGGAQAVERDVETGALSGGGDPRRGGVAVVA